MALLEKKLRPQSDYHKSPQDFGHIFRNGLHLRGILIVEALSFGKPKLC